MIKSGMVGVIMYKTVRRSLATYAADISMISIAVIINSGSVKGSSQTFESAPSVKASDRRLVFVA